jgi:hypothetical protein
MKRLGDRRQRKIEREREKVEKPDMFSMARNGARSFMDQKKLLVGALGYIFFT